MKPKFIFFYAFLSALTIFVLSYPCVLFSLDSGFYERQAITPYVDEQIFHEVGRILDSAQKRILIEMYIFQRRDFAVKLMDKARQGLLVRVLLEPKAPGAHSMIQFLRRRGVSVGLVSSAPDQIDHVKLLVVDGKTALLGSANWGMRSDRNHEAAVRVQGSSVAFLEKVFCEDWEKATEEQLKLIKAPAKNTGKSRIRFLTDRDYLTPLQDVLKKSHKQMMVGLFSFTSRKLALTIFQANRDGTRVFVIMDPLQKENHDMALLLSENRIKSRWYPVDQGKYYGDLHMKLAVVDSNETALGSANWTVHGFRLNHELNVLIEDPVVASFFEKALESDWNISLEQWIPHAKSKENGAFGEHPKRDYELKFKEKLW